MLILSEDQRSAVALMAAEPTRAALCAAETGTGKTLLAVALSQELQAQTVLIIGPIAGPVVTAWKTTFERQGVTLPFRRINSSQRGQAAFGELEAGTPGVYYVGREYLRISATDVLPKPKEDGTWTQGREALWDWITVHPDLAVFDEVQVASNRKSNTFDTLKRLNAGYKLAMSATPQGNKFTGVWSVCRWLWPKDRNEAGELYVDNSFWRWVATWAVQEVKTFWKGGQEQKVKNVTQEQVPGAFVNSLPCYVRIEATRLPVDERNVFVELTPRQRAMYDDMERDALIWLGEHPLVADISFVKRMRMRQITLGEVSFNDDGDVDFALTAQSSKIDALHKVLALHPYDPILILMDSRRFAKVVAHRLGLKAVAWTGDTSSKEREHILAEFGKSVQYLVATIPAISEGTDGLQRVCHIEVWLSKSLNNMLNIQVEGRLNRQGSPFGELISYTIAARNTDDDGRFENLRQQTIAVRDTLKKEA